MSIVSNNIKYLRRLNGLTQEQFARRIGIKRPSVGAYEEARAHPPYDVLIIMAKLFSVSVDQLIKTDLRRVRETPDLGLGADKPTFNGQPLNTSPPRMPDPQPVENQMPEFRTEAPKPIAAVVEKFYRDERKQIRLVAQRITPKRISFRTGLPPIQSAPQPQMRYPEIPAPAPVFNTNYEASVGSGRSTALATEAPLAHAVPFVAQSQIDAYARRFRDAEFISQLPTLPLPKLPAGLYRAFEAGADFLFPKASLIGKFVANWYELEDGRPYLLLVQNRGLLYRRVYNQVKIKGTLLLSADEPTLASAEVPIKDVLEAWEINAFLSYELPKPSLAVERLRGLVGQLQEELGRV